MIIKQKKKGNKRTVEVSGDLTVSNSLQFKKAILEEIEKGSRLELEIGEVKEIDLSFIQVLAAAVKTAEKNGCEFALKGPVHGTVVENMKLSGFLDHSNCEKPDCIWCSVLDQAQGA